MTPQAHPSPNHDERPAGTPTDMVVLHYTGMQSGALALDRLCDPDAKVSAHYLIEEDGRCFSLVSEDRRAWHAGVAYWRGHQDVNARSIGIELVNPGHEWGYRPFPDAQMQALMGLLSGIVQRHPIQPRNVVGHADVAPTRKDDPGELFDWQRLANAGYGTWPMQLGDACEPTAVARLLKDIGYETLDVAASLKAFQRHFLPDHLTGEADDKTRSCLAAVHATICR